MAASGWRSWSARASPARRSSRVRSSAETSDRCSQWEAESGRPYGPWVDAIRSLPERIVAEHADTEWLLLLDADIALDDGVVAALEQKRRDDQCGLVSVMATLHMATPAEKLLLPPFIYFFKLITIRAD